MNVTVEKTRHETAKKRLQIALKSIEIFEQKQMYSNIVNVDIYELFNISKSLPSDEAIVEFEKMKRYFHPDLEMQIPIQHRYAYHIIATEIVSTLTFYSITNLIDRKKKIEEYNKKISSTPPEQLDEFYKKAKRKYQKEKAEYETTEARKQNPQNKTDDEIMLPLINCSSRYYNKENSTDDYFYLFGLPKEETNEQILNSSEYFLLKNLFSIDSRYVPDYYQEVFAILKEHFSKFDNEILHNEAARKDYNKAVDRRNSYSFLGPSAKMIKGIMQEYRTKYYQKDFLDYYELFKLDATKTAAELRCDASLSYFHDAFDKSLSSKFVDLEDRKIFCEICEAIKNFIDYTLADETKKKKYDEKLNLYKAKENYKKQNQNNNQTNDDEYQYIYMPQYLKPSKTHREVRNIFYQIIQKSLIQFGATKTVLYLSNYLYSEQIAEVPVELQKYIKLVSAKDYKKMLKHDFGSASNTWIIQAVNCFLTEKKEILADNSYPTYIKHGEHQLAHALQKYNQDAVTEHFSRGNGLSGRFAIVKEIPPELLTRIIGTHPEYKYLLDSSEKIKNLKTYEDYAAEIIQSYNNVNQNKKGR